MVKAYNYLKATYKHAKDDFEKADKTLYNDRVHTCSRCDLYNDSDNSCNVCGCPIATKASWKSEKCPMNRWSEN